MFDLPNAVRNLRASFIQSEAQILNIASNFQKEMVNGLEGKESSLKMLPSFLTKATGKEKGVFLALDFGGTNVRILVVELKGNRQYEILKQHSFLLKDPEKGYDFTTRETSGTALFEYITEQIKSMLPPGSVYPLGFTFSFPSQHKDVNQATLIKWTKEIKTSGVENNDISGILTSALKSSNLTEQVILKAIINDTVGTLLASSYTDQNTYIGSICGTGHNTCYVEPRLLDTGEQMIVNMESGNFNKLPFTEYDDQLDLNSDIPGEQRLEKMVSGKYIGEITRIIIEDFIKKGLIFRDCKSGIFFSPYSINARDISEFLADESHDVNTLAVWLNDKCGISNSLLEERITLRTAASIVVTRSFQLAAATYIGVLQHIDPQLERKHTIAIDGSLYEFTPGYARKLNITLKNILKNKADLVSTKLTKDGSGIGAAIAAARAE